MGMQQGSGDVYYAMGTPAFYKARRQRMGDIVWRFNTHLNTHYIVYDEFEVRGTKFNELVELDGKEKEYTFSYVSTGADAYVSLLKFNYNDNRTALIAVIYNNVAGKWKIEDTEFVYLTQNGKTATQIYNDAIAQQRDGYIIDAAAELNDALMLVNNYSDMHYRAHKGQEFIELAQGLGRECMAAYAFPHIIEAIDLHPMITDVDTQRGDRQLVHYIAYKTAISIDDEEALKKEGRKMCAEVPKYLKGINFNKQKVYFIARGNKVYDDGDTMGGEYSYSYTP